MADTKSKTPAERPQVYRPRSAFVAPNPTGHRERFTPATLIPEGHWVLEGRESLFESVEAAAARTADPVTSVRPVEQATAAPGEQRATRRVTE